MSRSSQSLRQALFHEDDVRRVGGDRRGPRSEIETLAFFRAIESLMPSPTKQTFRPSFWSFST